MRAFVAIDIPEPAVSELVELQNALGAGRPVPEENLHLTLCFLGDQRGEALEEAHEALADIRAPAFELQLAGLGSFGKGAPQVIYADVARSDLLIELERRVTRSLRNAGLEFEKRRFRPHVTLARLPHRMSGPETARLQGRLADLAGFRGTPFPVDGFQLYQSTLTPDGAIHDVLAGYALEGVPMP